MQKKWTNKINNGIPKPEVEISFVWKKGKFKELIKKVKNILNK